FRGAQVHLAAAGSLRLGRRSFGGTRRRLPRGGHLRDAGGEAEAQMTPAIITAAICGAETTREMTPHLPITADELAEEAARCREAGASVIHLHVRRDDGTPTQDRALFQKALDAIRKRTDVIVQASTGGAVGMTADERAQPLECTPPPEMATLNAGSLNFGDDVFLNPFPLVREFARRMRAKGIAYELECYDVGHLEACLRLAEEGVIGLPA